jgi:nucleotide-binding universal stress UspA family protein
MSEILVGVDGTAGADDAVAFALALAGVTGATLRLATAFPYDDFRSRASNEAYRDALRVDALELIDRVAAEVGGDVPTEVVADTSPPHALHTLCEETGAALVVVGSTHRGPVGRVLPGSTAERLLHGSPCAVAIVPHGYSTGEHPMRTIGVGYDGSDECELALASAVELARRVGAELRVMRVFDSTQVGTPALMTGPGYYLPIHKEIEARQKADLERRVAELPDDVGAEAVFVAGPPARELAGFSHTVDVLLVGSRGYGPARAVLLGGISHALVRDAACPVIVLPRGSYPLFETNDSTRSLSSAAASSS